MPKSELPGPERRFRIGQVAKLIGVGPLLMAARTAKGQRYCTEAHIRLLRRIRRLPHEES